MNNIIQSVQYNNFQSNKYKRITIADIKYTKLGLKPYYTEKEFNDPKKLYE